MHYYLSTRSMFTYYITSKLRNTYFLNKFLINNSSFRFAVLICHSGTNSYAVVTFGLLLADSVFRLGCINAAW